MAEETKILVTDRPSAPDDNAVLLTKPTIPDVKIVSVPAWKLSLIRATRSWLQGVVATAPLLATGGPQAAAEATIRWLKIPLPADLWIILIALFVMPMGTAFITLGHNALDYFKEWDKTYPEMRG